MQCSGLYNNREFYINFSGISQINPQNLDNIPIIYAISGNWADISKDSSLYIGGTNDGKDRVFHNHISQLNNNSHCNQHLQRVYNKYGFENFSFFILENCNNENYFIREQNWLDYYNSNFEHKVLFNICDIVRQPPKPSDKTKKILADLKSHEWIVMFPNGEEKIIKNMKEFCRQNNLMPQNMNYVANGKNKTCKGFRCRRIDDKEYLYVDKTQNRYKNIKTSPYIIVYPDGKTIKVENLTKYCIENNLNYRTMYCISLDYNLTYKGLRCYKEENGIVKRDKICKPLNTKKRRRRECNYIVTFPDGKEVEISNMFRFCRENNLDRGKMSNIIYKKALTHKGFRVRYKDEPKENLIYKNRIKCIAISPENIIYNIDNLSQFCKEHNLIYVGMHNCLTGRQQNHKGWKCKYEK
jgi:hypothetical protein